MFLSIREALIHSIWARDEKVMDNLSFSGNYLKKIKIVQL